MSLSTLPEGTVIPQTLEVLEARRQVLPQTERQGGNDFDIEIEQLEGTSHFEVVNAVGDVVELREVISGNAALTPGPNFTVARTDIEKALLHSPTASPLTPSHSA